MRKERATFDGTTMPLVTRLARMGRRRLEREAEPGGLRQRQLLVLTVLNEREHASQQDIGAALGMDASNLVALLSHLEDCGLILRRRDPADRRRHLVELTTDGEAAVEAAHIRLGQIEDELLAPLSSEERRTLHDLLARVVDSTEDGIAVEDGSCA
ncbi:MarR family transcriptional regulator [Leifsonia sp. ZF2019]|uniref:MarR family winged helix-turn-helix transcriptional regulator n=1 Tax=Leifsonia sp. ZF2019 TaxID=2781978 RepID=UPI001CBE68ED|nr:MarR family transcriptional regulator [Leifsonia sp. ZF2019]UAJ81203.1 MarR family transcriptional regulator [Leifsonia sp. ZF2019]